MTAITRRGLAVAGPLAVLVSALLVPLASHAQGFSTVELSPTTSQEGGVFRVAGARPLSHGDWALGLMLDYADDPLVLYIDDEPFRDIVAGQMTANVLFAVGLGERLELGVALPVVLHQSGEAAPLIGVDASDAGAGLADPRLQAKLLFFDTGDGLDSPGIALGLVTDLYVPVGDEMAFQGDDGPRVHPRLALDVVIPSGIAIHVNAGYMVRPAAEVFNVGVDDTITYGAGLDVPVDAANRWHVLGEIAGQSSIMADEVQAEELPLELIVGARHENDAGVNVTAGFGTGLVTGFGAPDWRVLLGVEFARTGCTDCDEDGYPNREDACPEAAEDFDGFEDGDGCPDDDNDEDGVRDADDACPDQPEDMDGFEDGDGCPDDDNDGDGVLDTVDACPDTPEDIDLFQDDDGCPDDDNDGDGVPDMEDACPNQPEDIDAFEDEDGCPDPDNDGDGLLDDFDACPLAREDFDGFEDDDGCPEEGEGMVALTCARIEIRERVEFATDSDEIEEESFELLNQVATVLRSASYIRVIRVEGHTDSRGDTDYNLELSQRRADSVRAYLERAGVSQDIESVGFGEETPIADNDTRQGRRTNRRVEFHVVDQDATCTE